MHGSVVTHGNLGDAASNTALGRREFLWAALTATSALAAGRALGRVPGTGVPRPHAGAGPSRGAREIRLGAEVGEVGERPCT